MQGEARERWKQLAELAVTENDPDRLMALIREINTLLAEKENRLKHPPASQPAGSPPTRKTDLA